MSTNKNALLRYKILDKCFRNPGKNYFIEDLISECDKVLLELDPESNGISRRQIFEDISFMQSSEGWNIDLIKQRMGRRVFYRYSDLSFSINNMPLNEIEINNLKTAIDILSQFRGMPQFDWINETLSKLQIGITLSNKVTPIIDFDNNLYLKGIEFLGQLYTSIFYKKILTINYQPYELDKPIELIIHPYFLKQYNNRWFLFGFNPEFQKYDWNLAIDRIISVEESIGEYVENDQIDWIDYFDDIIGVTKPDDSAIENIILHFFGKTGRYIETKPLHGSQKSSWINDNLLEVRLNLVLNYEFERLIMSYADSIKIIQPTRLKEKLSIKLGEALKLNT